MYVSLHVMKLECWLHPITFLNASHQSQFAIELSQFVFITVFELEIWYNSFLIVDKVNHKIIGKDLVQHMQSKKV